jgi:dihydroxyacetone kinase-like protein
MNLNVEELRAAAVRAAAAAAAAADALNAQDGKMGDGDLGITVSAGYSEIAKEADSFPADLGQAFLLCAKAFQRVSASSYGTLTATAFMAAAKFAKGRNEVPWRDLGTILALARDAMMARGKGALGEKSVLDMLDAVSRAIDGLDDPAMIRSAARKAATQTLDTFRGQPCRLGRARAYGDASIGLDDPGMLALWRLVMGL